MTQVFISYSRKDLVFVERLAKDLQSAGLEVWYDLSGLAAGTRWGREIQNAIEESQIFVVVLSPNSIDSQWVEREFMYADSLKKKIIPLLYQPCKMPMWFINLHFIDVQGDNYDSHFWVILKAMGVNPGNMKKEVKSEVELPSIQAIPEKQIPPAPNVAPESAKTASLGRKLRIFPVLLIAMVGLMAVITFMVWVIHPLTIHYFHTITPTTTSINVPTVISTEMELSTPTPTLADTITPILMDAGTPTKTPVRTVYMPSFTSTPTRTLGPTATLQGGGYSQIAFASDRNGVPQIFMVNSEGSNLQQITNISEGACQPDWSPDGLHIVFISPCQVQQNDSTNNYLNAKLYIINFDGSGLKAVQPVQSGSFDPAWSPDGNRIAFASMTYGFAQIYVINLTDYKVSPLTQPSTDDRMPDWSRQPAWSPDGKHIAYTGHSRLVNGLQIWAMSDMGQDQTVLINRGPTYWDFQPSWSPDGKTILFNEELGSQSLGWLMLFDYENSQTAQAVHWRSGIRGNQGSYSPDGLWLVYQSINAACASCDSLIIYVARNASGYQPINVSGETAENFDPVWRPIGSP